MDLSTDSQEREGTANQNGVIIKTQTVLVVSLPCLEANFTAALDSLLRSLAVTLVCMTGVDMADLHVNKSVSQEEAIDAVADFGRKIQELRLACVGQETVDLYVKLIGRPVILTYTYVTFALAVILFLAERILSGLYSLILLSSFVCFVAFVAFVAFFFFLLGAISHCSDLGMRICS